MTPNDVWWVEVSLGLVCLALVLVLVLLVLVLVGLRRIYLRLNMPIPWSVGDHGELRPEL